MRDENRVKLADELFVQIAGWEFPADKFLNNFFRKNRFAGSKDRRFIQDEIYTRLRALGDSPEWLLKYFPSNFEKELAALNTEAPTDVRVNTLKSSLKSVGLDAEPTPLSPIGLRLKSRQALKFTGSYEVQDEGSQLVSLYCDARPGMSVLDYCAGAGGKTLALAAEMKNKGSITAYDSDPRKLEILKTRAERAKVKIINFEIPNGLYDLVIVDAPCSGTGTWRRAPDAKWRLNEEKLKSYIEMQSKILDEAAIFVRPGGKLVYITCSVIPDENEKQIEKFLNRSNFKLTKEPLNLSPLKSNTDGFFAASLIRN